MRAFCLCLPVLWFGCAERSEPSSSRSPAAPSAPPTAANPSTAPSRADGGEADGLLQPVEGPLMQELRSGDVVDFVSVPIGARAARPVVVALHGMDARPEWLCNDFRATYGPWPWIVCARGDARSPANYSWSSPAALARSIQRALGAADARWPGYLAAEDRVLVSYSQSSSLAPAMLAQNDAPRFSSGFFLEGFTKSITSLAAPMHAHGLVRAVFVATQAGNRAPAEASAAALKKRGIAASAQYAGPLGHWFQPKTVPELRKIVPESVRDLPAWQGYPGPPTE